MTASRETHRNLMRALGPGSVSSILKTALDVVFWVLLAGGAVVVVGVPIAVLTSGRLSYESPAFTFIATGDNWPIIVGALTLVAAVLAGLLIIVQCLRRVFHTLTIGEPFQEENVRRLRVIGFTLAGLEGLTYLANVVGPQLATVHRGRIDWWPDFTAWFAILVVFVLAEVFREGARLRREADLTI